MCSEVINNRWPEGEAEGLAAEPSTTLSPLVPWTSKALQTWEIRSGDLPPFGVPVSVSVSGQSVSSWRAEIVPYSCFIANTWHCMNFNKAQCLLSLFECLFFRVDCSWEQKLCLIHLYIPAPSMFVDPNRVEFSARQNILWLRMWTFCQMGLS